jgi:hypothetical protein
MKINSLIVLLFISTNLLSQNWEQVGINKLDYYVRVIYSDTIENKLYIGGNFTDDGNTNLNGIGVLENNDWENLGNGMVLCCYPTLSITKFNGLLIASGGQGITYWDQNQWHFFDDSVSGGVNQLYCNGDYLYIGGNFDSIGSIPAKGIAKWNGQTWEAIGNNQYDFASYGVFTMVHYNGELYIGGNFNQPDGLNNIARWDGQNWNSVGNGFVGGLADVVDMEVYHGELYAAGTFTYDNGANPGNYIARWDGQQWHDVGGGVIGINGTGNGQIHDLCVFNNELYAGGVFRYAGGIAAEYIAKWDGTQWCSLGSDLDAPVSCLDIHNSELYVGGGFGSIDGDSIQFIAKWIGGNYTDTCGAIISVEENNIETFELEIYPNPTTNLLTIKTNAVGKAEYFIYDINGRKLSQSSILNNQSVIDVSNFAEGLYLLQVQTDKGSINHKFIKRK